jgi:hypothetical protein
MIELLELLFNLSLAFLMLLVFGVLLDATIDHFRASRNRRAPLFPLRRRVDLTTLFENHGACQ